MSRIGTKLGGDFASSFRASAKAALKPLDVTIDTAGAETKIKAFASKKRTTTVDVDANTAGAEANITRLGRSAGSAIPNVSGLALALASIGPIGIPAIAAATAGIVGLGSAIAGATGSALGVGALAFHGIGDAVKALGEESSATAKKVQAAGTSALQAATRMYAIRDAARSVKNAEQGLADAQRNTLTAQRSLNDARKEAAKLLDDLKERTIDGKLSERQANLDVLQAKQDLERIVYDPRAGKLERDQARLSYDEALRNQQKVRKENKDLAKEKAEADKKGIKNSDAVKSAEERIREAQRAQLRAQQDLTQAKERQALASMRDEKAVKATVPEVTKLKSAFDKLGPAGQKFAKYIYSLEPAFKKLKRTAEDNLLPGVQKALESLATPENFRKVDKFVASVAKSMASVARDWAKSLGGKTWTKAFETLSKDAPGNIKTLGDIGKQVGEIFAGVFTASSPSGKTLLGDLDTFLARVNKWVNSPDGQKRLQKFFDDAIPAVKAMGKLALKILGLFAALAVNQGFINFVDGLSSIIQWMTDFTNAHPKLVEAGLWGIVSALLALKAIKIGAGFADGVSAIGSAVGVGGKGKVGKLGKKVGRFGKAGKVGSKLGKGGLIGTGAAIVGGFAGDAIQDGKGGGRDVAGRALSDGITGAAIGGTIGSVIPVIGTAIGAAIGGLLGAIYGAWKALGTDGVKGLAKGTWDTLKKGYKNYENWMDKYVTQPVREYFGIGATDKSGSNSQESGSRKFQRIGSDIINGLTFGIWNKLVSFAGKIPGWFKKHVIDPVKSFFKIKSPSRVFEVIGHQIINGFTGGIWDKLVAFKNAIPRWLNQHVISPTLAFFGIGKDKDGKERNSKFADIGKNLISDFAGGIYNKLKEVAGKLKGWLKDLIIKPITEAASTAFNGAKGIKDKAGGLLGGIKNKVGGLIGGGGGGKSAPTNVSGNQAIVKNAAASMGWTGNQWNALYNLVMGESGFRNTAQNPSSTAYGMFQFLNSTWAGVGGHKTADPALQAKYGLQYIKQSYGTPVNAYAKWSSRSPHWYDSGGDLMPGMTMAYNGTGKVEKILTAEQWKMVDPTRKGADGSGDQYNIYTDNDRLVRDLERMNQRRERRLAMLPR